MPSLEPILKRDVDLEVNQAEYDALMRLGAAARGQLLHRAGTQLGQLCRAVNLCDYSAHAAFRRQINRLLVRGESVHQL